MQQRETDPPASFRRVRSLATLLALLLALLLLTTGALHERPDAGPSSSVRPSLTVNLLQRTTLAVLPAIPVPRYSSGRPPVLLGSRN